MPSEDSNVNVGVAGLVLVMAGTALLFGGLWGAAGVGGACIAWGVVFYCVYLA